MLNLTEVSIVKKKKTRTCCIGCSVIWMSLEVMEGAHFPGLEGSTVMPKLKGGVFLKSSVSPSCNEPVCASLSHD